MDAKEIRQKNEQELKTLAAELRTKVASLRFGLRQGAKVSELRTLRRDLARVNLALAQLTKN